MATVRVSAVLGPAMETVTAIATVMEKARGQARVPVTETEMETAMAAETGPTGHKKVRLSNHWQ